MPGPAEAVEAAFSPAVFAEIYTKVYMLWESVPEYSEKAKS